MRYINKEYGFEGRPPFFKEYSEIKSKGPSKAEFRYPNKEHVGYGLHYAHPNAAILTGKLGSIWGVKILYQKYGKWVETKDFLEDIGNFFAAKRDGSFAYFNHGDITASFTKYSQNKLVLLISAMTKVKVKLEFFAVAPKEVVFSEEEDQLIKAVAKERAVIPGNIELLDYDMMIKDRYEVEFTENDSRQEYFVAKGYCAPSSVTKNGNNSIIYEYTLDEHFSRIMFFLAVGDEEIFNAFPSIDELNDGTSKTELIFTAERIVGSGILGENVSNAISRSVWQKIYDPYLQMPLFIESRVGCNDYYSYDSTKLAVGALIQTFMGEYKGAINQLRVCIKDKILGALTAWIIFCRTRNKKVIEEFLPKLLEVNQIDGELIKTDGISLREIAYKQKNSPLKDIDTSALYSLDMNCYKLISLDIMHRMAIILKHPLKDKLINAKKDLKKSINYVLFNDRLGLYMDRYLSGEFVPIFGINSFLPLIAGVIDDADRLEKAMLILRDTKKFGGDYMIPTLVKSHPLYGKKSINRNNKEVMPYEGYRGMVSPLLNFLVYFGLKRYGVSELQSKVAKSSTRMYAEILKKYNMVPNFYAPIKNTKCKGCLAQSLSGNLLAFIGMTELIDVEYFRDDMKVALSFGTLVEGANRLANMPLLGKEFSIKKSDKQTTLSCNGEEFFKGSGGRFIVRHFTEKKQGAEFIIFAEDDITLNITLPALVKSEKRTNYLFNMQKGKYKVIIDKNSQIKPTRLQFNT